MRIPFSVILIPILAASSATMVRLQEARPTEANHIGDLKTVVVAKEAKSDAEIAVPPLRSVSFNVSGETKVPAADAVDLPSWLTKEAALNGLQSPELLPWHIVVTCDQFDE